MVLFVSGDVFNVSAVVLKQKAKQTRRSGYVSCF